MSNFLTRDNPLLSRPTLPDRNILSDAIACTKPLPDLVAGYVTNSLAENTRRAYLSDLAHFENWGGSLPSNDKMLALYFASHAETLSVATLVRRLTSISKAHDARGYESPTRSSLVRATLRGIKRKQGTAQRQAKPLLKEDLIAALDAMGDTLRDVRDRALLLIGFAGAFRRSELVALDKGDIGRVREGIIINLRRSKTDQTSKGRRVAIPRGRARWCPVSALDTWLDRSGIHDAAVFRPVNSHGVIGTGRLSAEAVSLIIKQRVAATGLDPAAYSGHSLRAGFVTSAAQAGVPTWRIRAQTGHTSDSMLQRYIREAELFVQNDAGALL
jgi:integrase